MIAGQPKVSVCVVTYNQEQYITDCLRSIVTQKTDFEFEVIVGDDCSTDSTRDIIRQFASEYPHLIKPVFYETNKGSSANYNYIHSIARGEFVSHCDGDDLFNPGKLQRLYDFLRANPDYAVAWHKVLFFNDSGQQATEYVKPEISAIGQTVDLGYVLRNGTVATHSSIMYRKSAKKTYNPTYETMDLYFTIEFLMSGKGMILHEVLGQYRINPSSYSRVSSSKLMMRKLVIEHWTYFYEQLPHERPRILIFATINFLVDLKNFRKTAWGFLRLMFDSLGTFSLIEFYDSLKNTRYLRLPQLQ